LLLIVIVLGPALTRIPLHVVQLAVGTLLLCLACAGFERRSCAMPV
jgi:uncharacterized membrane protein